MRDCNKNGWPPNVVQPDGTSVFTEYYLTGELKKTWGSRTYPVEYTYDYAGRMKTLKTWQDFAGNSGTAITTWNYDLAQGWLTNKAYADGAGPVYSNTPAGRLATRKWARLVGGQPLVTTYSYNNAGDLATIEVFGLTDGLTLQRTRVRFAGRPLTPSSAQQGEYGLVGQEQGGEIVLTSFGRTTSLTEKTAKRLPDPPDVLELDANDPEHVAALRRELERRWGSLDGFLHAIAFDGDLIQDEQWRFDLGNALSLFLWQCALWLALFALRCPALHLGLVQKLGGDDNGGRPVLPFEADRVMHTARRARASVADRGQDHLLEAVDQEGEVAERLLRLQVELRRGRLAASGVNHPTAWRPASGRACPGSPGRRPRSGGTRSRRTPASGRPGSRRNPSGYKLERL